MWKFSRLPLTGSSFEGVVFKGSLRCVAPSNRVLCTPQHLVVIKPSRVANYCSLPLLNVSHKRLFSVILDSEPHQPISEVQSDPQPTISAVPVIPSSGVPLNSLDEKVEDLNPEIQARGHNLSINPENDHSRINFQWNQIKDDLKSSPTSGSIGEPDQQHASNLLSQIKSKTVGLRESIVNNINLTKDKAIRKLVHAVENINLDTLDKQSQQKEHRPSTFSESEEPQYFSNNDLPIDEIQNIRQHIGLVPDTYPPLSNLKSEDEDLGHKSLNESISRIQWRTKGPPAPMDPRVNSILDTNINHRRSNPDGDMFAQPAVSHIDEDSYNSNNLNSNNISHNYLYHNLQGFPNQGIDINLAPPLNKQGPIFHIDNGYQQYDHCELGDENCLNIDVQRPDSAPVPVSTLQSDTMPRLDPNDLYSNNMDTMNTQNQPQGQSIADPQRQSHLPPSMSTRPTEQTEI